MVTHDDLPGYVEALGEAMRAVGAVRGVFAAGPVRELVLAPTTAPLEAGDAPPTAEQLAQRAEAMLYASAGL